MVLFLTSVSMYPIFLALLVKDMMLSPCVGFGSLVKNCLVTYVWVYLWDF